MRVLILEQQYGGGHYLNWVKFAVMSLTGLASEIVVGVPAAARGSVQYELSLAPIQEHFRLYDLPPDRPANRFKMIKSLAKITSEAIKDVRPDALYLPTGDGSVDAINLALLLGQNVLGRLEHSEVLLMRRSAAYSIPDPRIPAWVSNLSIRIGKWSRILAIDPVVYGWLKNDCGSRVATRAVLAPDPIEPMAPIERGEARRLSGLPETGRIVTSLGLQEARKGVDLLLEAFLAADLRSTDYLVLAGPLGPEIRTALKTVSISNLSRIHVVDRYLSSHELHQYACASDLVAVPSRGVALPSGTVIRSVAARRPVITNNKGWFARMVPKFQLGTICDVENIEEFATLLPDALEQARSYQLNAAAERLIEYQRPENFMAVWRSGLAAKMGRKAGPIRTWDWVLEATTDISTPADQR
jgi:glycosyltransferase involved in cell wall biosynthesis